jgi:segregation and condensation protein B
MTDETPEPTSLAALSAAAVDALFPGMGALRPAPVPPPVTAFADTGPEDPFPGDEFPGDEFPGAAPLPGLDSHPLDDPVELRAALEAILLVVDEPVSETLLAQTLDRPPSVISRAVAQLAAEYTAARRGFDLRKAAGGWRLYTRSGQAHHVERFVLEGQQARLTQAALETLAVIAYKQPVTRSRVSAIRGVSVDGVIRTLLTRGLIAEAGTDPDSGGHLYRTTSLFLEKLGLDSLDDLPALAPLLPGMDALDDVIASAL